MQRTYLALAGIALASAAVPAALPSLGRAAGVFQSQPLDSTGFALLARPLASGEWNLVILEQIQPSPLCWQRRSDGLIDPVLNRFNYTGICGRYLDSNGYSLRVGEQDLGGSYRLSLEQQGSELLLQATAPGEPTALVLGRARVSHRDRDAFVALELDPGWELQRRMYGERSLNHLYLANSGSLRELLARSGGSRTAPPKGTFALAAVPPPPPILPPAAAPLQRSGSGSLRQRRVAAPTALEAALQGVSGASVRSVPTRNGNDVITRIDTRIETTSRRAVATDDADPLEADTMVASGQAIPLQVIPFRE
jgi:hypothetical protein